MRVLGALVLAAALLACVHAKPAPTAPPEARVVEGALRGVWEDGFAVFKGVPYAAPPQGAWRWRPPQPAPYWSGIRDAGAYGPICFQPVSARARAADMSEDCLTLNIWTPRLAASAHLPVMVWIHGGAFVAGSGRMPEGISALSRRGIVLVTLNYRLGRFGFFAYPELAQEHPAEAIANYWLMDQIAALKWVHANIAAFGGDPANVTIFGVSAGGSSVNALIASPAAAGLMRRAIVHSGGGLFNAARPLARAEQEAQRYAARQGEGQNERMGLAQLSALSPEQILAAESGPPDFGAIIDGRLLPDALPARFAHRQANPVDYMVGSTSGEASVFGLMGFDADVLERRFGVRLADLRHAYPPDLRDAQLLHEVQTDFIFTSATDALARFSARTGRPTYAFRFAYIAESRRAAQFDVPHGGDIPYVFGLDNMQAADAPSPSAADRRIADMVATYWTNFAKTGDPNGAGLPAWPRYGLPAPQTLVIDTQTGAVADFRRAQIDAFFDLWRRQGGVDVPR